MNLRITLATARRVLSQLRHDRRTLGLLLVVPCVLLTLLWWILIDRQATFDHAGAALLAIFPLLMMFIVTSVAMLRERTSGTLERLLAMPMGKLDLLVGYALAFGLVAVVQSVLASGLMLTLLDLDIAGPPWVLTLTAVLVGLLGMALGLSVSALAATEFQAVQFMPAAILPQTLLCGLLVPRAALPSVLQTISNLLPLSYAVDAMQELTVSTGISGTLIRNLGVIAVFAILALAVGALTLKRQTG